MKALEFKLDSFAAGVHKVEKSKEVANGVLDEFFSNAVKLLEEKDERASTSAHTERIGIGDLLRSFARAT